MIEFDDDEEDDDTQRPSIPHSVLTKLYDATGTPDGSQRGVFLFFINDEGDPFCWGEFENTGVRMALEKAIDNFQESKKNHL